MVHVRSRFQHGGAVSPPPPLGGVLGEATFPLSSVGWCSWHTPSLGVVVFPPFFLEGAAFLPLLLWVGLLFHLLLRAAAFLLLL